MAGGAVFNGKRGGRGGPATTYVQRLLEAVEDMDDAIRGVYEFSHSTAVDKLLDCYFSLIKFELEFKTDYERDMNETDPYQVLALHVILVKLQFDIDDLLLTVNKNTVQSHVSVLKRLFTNNRAFGEVVSVLNRVTRLNLISKTPIADEESAPLPPPPRLPTGLSRFDMTVAAGFDTIVGQDEAVRRIRKSVEQACAVSQPLSLVLYGPPGTGKTSIALAVGREYKLHVYATAVSSLGGHYVGEREKNIVEMFDFLEGRDEDLLLFVDEADSFLTNVGPDDTPQSRYTHAVTVELFDKFLRPNVVAEAAAVEDSVDSGRKKQRLLLLATNFVDDIATEIVYKSMKILIDVPRTADDMRRLVEYYRQSNRVNMTGPRLERVARYALMCELAPSHVSQVMRRMATQVLLDMLKRGVVVRKYKEFAKSARRPLGLLALPFFTVGGVAVKRKPELGDTVVRVFDENREDYNTFGRMTPLAATGGGGDGLSSSANLYGVDQLPAGAVYPWYDGDIERFFRSFPKFPPSILLGGADSSVEDPEYVEPLGSDNTERETRHRTAGGSLRIGLDPDELKLS